MANLKARNLTRILVVNIVLLLALVISTGAAQAASFTIDHTGNNVAGWFVGNDPDPRNTGALTATFEPGPGTPPAGAGSLEVAITGGGYSKFWISRDDYQNTLLSDITTLSYATYYDSASTGTSATWYLNLYVDTTGDGVRDVRLDFAPGGLVEDTWQSWNLLEDAHWRINGPPSTARNWDYILDTYPGARLANQPFAGNDDYPSLVFNMGDSASNYQNITTNIDNIQIGIDGAVDDWDLEPPGAACLLANCSFENPDGPNKFPASWKRSGLSLPGDSVDTEFFVDGDQSFRFKNTTPKAKTLYQDVSLSGPAGDEFNLTFSWRGNKVTGKPGLFRVMAVLYYTGGGSRKFYINMPIGNHDWTEYSLPFKAKKDYKKLRVEIDFGKKGAAWFDDFVLEINPE